MQNRTAGSSLAFTSRDKSKSFRLEAEKQVGGAGGGRPLEAVTHCHKRKEVAHKEKGH